MFLLIRNKYLGTLATFTLITTKSCPFIIDITLKPMHLIKIQLHRTLLHCLKKRSMKPDFFQTFLCSSNIQLKLGSEFGSVIGVPNHIAFAARLTFFLCCVHCRWGCDQIIIFYGSQPQLLLSEVVINELSPATLLRCQFPSATRVSCCSVRVAQEVFSCWE